MIYWEVKVMSVVPIGQGRKVTTAGLVQGATRIGTSGVYPVWTGADCTLEELREFDTLPLPLPSNPQINIF